MKRRICRIMAVILLLSFSIQIYAEGDPNIDGGGGDMGQGDSQNVWAVKDKNGNKINDAEGLRIYVVNADTGVPVSPAVDFTNFDVAEKNMNNGRGKTKYEYTHVSDSLSNFDTDYIKKKVDTSPLRLPQIIPWSEGNNTARIEAIESWLLDKQYADWIFGKLGTTADIMKSKSYKLAIEPIAYFRYDGLEYAMTATEAALFNQATGGDLRNKMGPLTHKNLPLSMFLEKDEFENSPYRVSAWGGSHTATASDSDIINYLGIGYISYAPEEDEDEPVDGADLFRYPTNTWVVTSFKLCSIRKGGSGWIPGIPLTLRNPASASINIEGSVTNISSIYIPKGGEQLVWVKWKTPPRPCRVSITASGTGGLFYNNMSENDDDQYANTIYATAEIYDRDEENTPPDPTVHDTKDGIGYTGGAPNLSNVNKSASWIVWNCYYQLTGVSSETVEQLDTPPNIPGDYYNAEEGKFYEHNVTSRKETTVIFQEETGEKNSDGGANYRNVEHTLYTVKYDKKEYTYMYNPLNYSAELRSAALEIKPSVHCPTWYKKYTQIFMKSGYGINAETEAYLYVNEKGTNRSVYDPATTSYAAAPQQIAVYFPEFNYQTYTRFLEKTSTKWNFKQNKYSAYLDRSHFTPWWFPDFQNYTIVAEVTEAYTPAGKLSLNLQSNGITIEGNLYDDWHVAPVRVDG